MRATAPHLLAVCAVATACVRPVPEARAPGGLEGAGPSPISGTVRYEARTPTPRGASSRLELRPVRLAEVEALDAAGRVLAQTRLDRDGRFEIADVPAATARIVVRARVRAEGHDIAVCLDAMGRRPHEIGVGRDATGAGGPLDIVARDADPAGAAGAFHILDTVLRGYEAVRLWGGSALPPIFVYWARGVTTEWSFYRGERPEGSGRYALELLGGEPGKQTTTDTDEHDESIVLHELGHFIMDMLSTDSSTGGRHPPGHLVDPGLAWEEGRADWLSAAVLGAPSYVDTIGLEPEGSLRTEYDLERRGEGPRGIGSELGVAEILWDLADGAAGLPDADADGIALGPAPLLRAMIEMRTLPEAYPCIASFLSHLIERGVLEEAEIKAMLDRTGQPRAVLGPPEGPEWPQTVRAPGRLLGTIDGLSSPAPSGGPPRPDNGLDAMRAYRVRIESMGLLVVRLRISGSGRGADHQDLDLELRDHRADIVQASRTEDRVETVAALVEPGWCVVYVRDGGSGNRVGYELELRLEPAP